MTSPPTATERPTRRRTGLGADLGSALVGAAAVWAAMLSWGGFTENDPSYLMPLVAVGLVIAGVGAAARTWRVPRPVVPLLQAVAALLVVGWTMTGTLPVGGGWTQLVTAFAEAGESAQAFASPVPDDAPSIAPLLVAAGAATMLVVDLLASTLRRAPLAGLPLLTVYCVPISLLGRGAPVPIFVLTAATFVAMLYLHATASVNRWGRPLESRDDLGSPIRDAAGFGVRTGAARARAGGIGTVATALALVVPLLVPTLRLSVFDFGAGPGDGDEVTIQNPTADLLRDLIRGEDVPLVRLSTDDPDPDYLRVTVLKRFSGSEWSPGDRDIPPENRPEGAMPALQGVSRDVNRRQYGYDVEITDDFRSFWLPTQAPISAIEAEGDWRFDAETTDFFHWDEDLDTRGMDYTMTGVELDIDARDLEDAPLSRTQVDEEFLELPGDLPDIVRQTTFEVTGRAESKYEQAVALQDWFRENFEYSLEAGPQGNGADQLEIFLSTGSEGRVGYCEQFAAAMATMGRVLDIPSRMVVGFLEPEQQRDGSFVYSAHDLHAWPELYFDGYGWVRFEPTPPVRAAQVPGYARGLSDQAPEEEPSASASPSDSASAGVPEPTETLRQDPQAPNVEGEEDAAQQPGVPWPWIGLGGGMLLLAAALVLPSVLRRRQRERRLAGGPEAVWLELRATAVDLRLPWPPGRSPRETRDRLVELFGRPDDEFAAERPARGPLVNPDAVLALDRVVGDLELVRYSAAGRAEVGVLGAEGRTCLEALEAGVVPRVRRRARWWPASVLPGAHARDLRGADTSRTERSSWSGVVERMG